MPNNELPKRVPFVGPFHGWWQPPSVEVMGLFVDAVSRFEFPTAPEETSRCRGVESSGIGRTNGEA